MDPAPVCVAAWQWFHYVRKCQSSPQNDHYICAWYHDIDHEYQYDYNILIAQFAPDLLLVTYKNIIYISILHGFKHGLNHFNLNFSEWVGMSTWRNVDFLQYTHTPHTRKHTHTHRHHMTRYGLLPVNQTKSLRICDDFQINYSWMVHLTLRHPRCNPSLATVSLDVCVTCGWEFTFIV